MTTSPAPHAPVPPPCAGSGAAGPLGAVPVTLSGPAWRPTPVERQLLDRLGGTPWTTPDPAVLEAAVARWAALRQMLGYADTSTNRWMTDDSAKLNKTTARAEVDAAVGVTLLSATGAAVVWSEVDDADRRRWAEVLGTSVEAIDAAVGLSVCPRSTTVCRDVCVVHRSRNATNRGTPRTRLARTLLTLMQPAEALELTHAALIRLAERHGDERVRWRMNVGDDIRWERVAPAMLGIVPAYAYTKFAPAERPETVGQTRIVYSASEHWTDQRIIDTCARGHNVAVVFDVVRNAPLPTRWRGVEVVDGNATDDLWVHRRGTIVGLSAKGPDNATVQRALDSGFARPVD